MTLNGFIKIMKWLSIVTSAVLAIATGYIWIVPVPPGSDSGAGVIMFMAGITTTIALIFSGVTSIYFSKMAKKSKINKIGLAFFSLLAIVLLAAICIYGVTLLIASNGN